MTLRILAASALALATAVPALAATSISISGSNAFDYLESFDSLATSATASNTAPIAWSNGSTLDGWSLYTAGGSTVPSYIAGTGASNAGSFYSFGAAGSSDRALGGTGSGGSYFGAPASGAAAGYIVVSFLNDRSTGIASATIRYDGEQWRNGGNTSAQTMALQYGYGANYGDVSWTTADGAFGFGSPVTGSTAAAVDGNGAGLGAGRGGMLSTAAWASGETLWLRWTETNDVGNDHGLAIDNFSLAVAPVPEPETWAMLVAGLATVATIARRRRTT